MRFNPFTHHRLLTNVVIALFVIAFLLSAQAGELKPLADIAWLDILGDAGHADSKDFLNMRPAKMVSQGYVFKKDKKYLWTFASYDENEAVFSDRNCFPIGCIVSMNKIEI